MVGCSGLVPSCGRVTLMQDDTLDFLKVHQKGTNRKSASKQTVYGSISAVLLFWMLNSVKIKTTNKQPL